MRKLLILLLILAFGTQVSAQKNPPRPKLVVGIVVDQMRYDYLYRFQENYVDGGFKRLMNGANFHSCFIPYLPSFTAPGHTCIYTGSVPSLHGIVANDWIELENENEIYCVEDDTAKTVGSGSDNGKMSPANLLASTVTDEYRLGTNFKSKVFGVSIKDRGAILPAGHLGQAYWYDGEIGGFVTSTFYRNALPSWVSQFNNSGIVDKYFSQGWDLLLPASKYYASRSDDNEYEGILKTGGKTFPHDLEKYRGVEFDAIRATPWGNTITLDFAKTLIDQENLGKQSNDFLAVSLSSTDYIGHIFGPQSLEVEDTYIRLDRDLQDFFQYLDKSVGKDSYVVFLTADHGAAHNAQYLMDLKASAGYFWEKEEVDYLDAVLDKKFGRHDFIRDIKNYYIYLDHDKLKGLDENQVRDFIVNLYLDDERISKVFDMKTPEKWNAPELIREMAMNNYYNKRSGDILILPNPQYYAGYYKTGTVHGTWNPYDTHIPLLFYGSGIGANKDIYERVEMTDIAPTLSDLLLISTPNACIGQSRYSLIKNQK